MAGPVALAAQAATRPSVRLGGVDGGVRRGVEHDGVLVPRPGGDRLGVGEVECSHALAGEQVDPVGVGVRGVQRAAELAQRPDDQRLLGRIAVDGSSVGLFWSFSLMIASASGIGQAIAARRVVERQRGVGDAGAPVLVDEVGVGRRVLEHLVAVADAARNEDRHRGVHLEGEGGPERLALAHVDPGAEDPAGGQRDELVPRLGVDAAGDAAVAVEGDVVLHRTEVGQADREHLLALPVLLEEPAVVVATVEPYDDEAGDRRRLEGGEGRHHWPFWA